jgi:hypothetical protein
VTDAWCERWRGWHACCERPILIECERPPLAPRASSIYRCVQGLVASEGAGALRGTDRGGLHAWLLRGAESAVGCMHACMHACMPAA